MTERQGGGRQVGWQGGGGQVDCGNVQVCVGTGQLGGCGKQGKFGPGQTGVEQFKLLLLISLFPNAKNKFFSQFLILFLF